MTSRRPLSASPLLLAAFLWMPASSGSQDGVQILPAVGFGTPELLFGSALVSPGDLDGLGDFCVSAVAHGSGDHPGRVRVYASRSGVRQLTLEEALALPRVEARTAPADERER